MEASTKPSLSSLGGEPSRFYRSDPQPPAQKRLYIYYARLVHVHMRGALMLAEQSEMIWHDMGGRSSLHLTSVALPG